MGIALQSVKPTANPNDIDDDWLSQFMDKARLVSDSDFQILWGNILAEECNVPNSVPKSLLHIMEQMDKEMAMAFMAIASVSVYVDEECAFTPLIWEGKLEEYKEKFGITLDSLLNLQAIGLIETRLGPFTTGFSMTCSTVPITIHYFDEQYQMPVDVKDFGIGQVVYTKAGSALCRAVRPQKINGFLAEYCIPQWDAEILEKRTDVEQKNEEESN